MFPFSTSPIRSRKWLVKFNAVNSDSAIFPNNKSSLIDSRKTRCPHQSSWLPSILEWRLRWCIDLLHVPTFGPGNANITAGLNLTVTNSILPLISSRGSILWDRHKSIISGIRPTLQHTLYRHLFQFFLLHQFQSASAEEGIV